MTNLEKLQLLPILKLYKDSACLWDQANVLYSNKQARRQAYSVLLDKFKNVYEDANYDSLKKKIDNMRTAYKRERKKVIAAKAKGEEYRPTLWYYEHLRFLDRNIPEDESSNDIATEFDDSEETRLDYEYIYEEKESKPKRPKISSVYLETDENKQSVSKMEQVFAQTVPSALHSAETQSFGRTVGLQLKDLDSYQRAIAEKLISDAIFYGRLNKLTDNSCISLNFTF